MKPWLFQFSCLALLVSPAALYPFGAFGLILPVALFTVCLALAFSLGGGDRKIALCYSLFFGFMAMLFSLAFSGILPWVTVFPAALLLFAFFFGAIKFLVMGSTLEATVLSWHDGLARVQVKRSLHSTIKPGVYFVECPRKKSGVVKIKVEKSLFGDKPVGVI